MYIKKRKTKKGKNPTHPSKACGLAWVAAAVRRRRRRAADKHCRGSIKVMKCCINKTILSLPSFFSISPFPASAAIFALYGHFPLVVMGTAEGDNAARRTESRKDGWRWDQGKEGTTTDGRGSSKGGGYNGFVLSRNIVSRFFVGKL